MTTMYRVDLINTRVQTFEVDKATDKNVWYIPAPGEKPIKQSRRGGAFNWYSTTKGVTKKLRDRIDELEAQKAAVAKELGRFLLSTRG